MSIRLLPLFCAEQIVERSLKRDEHVVNNTMKLFFPSEDYSNIRNGLDWKTQKTTQVTIIVDGNKVRNGKQRKHTVVMTMHTQCDDESNDHFGGNSGHSTVSIDVFDCDKDFVWWDT